MSVKIVGKINMERCLSGILHEINQYLDGYWTRIRVSEHEFPEFFKLMRKYEEKNPNAWDGRVPRIFTHLVKPIFELCAPWDVEYLLDQLGLDGLDPEKIFHESGKILSFFLDRLQRKIPLFELHEFGFLDWNEFYVEFDIDDGIGMCKRGSLNVERKEGVYVFEFVLNGSFKLWEEGSNGVIEIK